MRQITFTVQNHDNPADTLKEACEFMRNYQPWHTGKVQYGHRETADKAAALMKEKHGRDLEAYQCKTCGKWHLGGKRD